MYLLGYSLDNLSLLALTLAVGFVVDDAIVMLENIVRHLDMGKTPLRGGARRVGGGRLHDRLDDRLAGRGVHPGAVHGRDRRPAAARVRGHDLRRDPRLGRWSRSRSRRCCAAASCSARARARATAALLPARPSAAFDARRARATTAPSAGRCGPPADRCSCSRCVRRRHGVLPRTVPKGFLPSEDTGQHLRQHRGPRRTCRSTGWSTPAAGRRDRRARTRTSRRSCRTVGGGGARARHGNPGGCSSASSRASERKLSADEMIAQLRPQARAACRASGVFLQNPPPIRIGGRLRKSQYQFTLQGPDIGELYAAAPKLEARLRELPRSAGRDERPADPQPAAQRSRSTATRRPRSA